MEPAPQVDVQTVCRTCRAQSADMISVFDTCEILAENPRIDEMLMACVALQVKPEDGLPTVICLRCSVQLKDAYAFKQQALQTDSSFRQFTKSVNLLARVKEEIHNAGGALSETLVQTMTTDEPAEAEVVSHPKSDYIEFLDNNQMLLTCRDCQKMFTTLEGLRSHKRIHSGSLFKCKFCGKGYTRQTHVYRHELSHGKHKLHVCRVCNKTLTRMEHLKRHLTTHLKEKPYSCEACHRGFNRTDHLDNHKLRCKGDRLYICDICNRGFARQDSLDVHKRLHENQKPVLPTLDNIDNIEEHYYEIDHDPNVNFSPPSPASDIDDDYLEPHVEVTENFDEDRVADLKHEALDIADDKNDVIKSIELAAEKNSRGGGGGGIEVMEEEGESSEEDDDDGGGGGNDAGDNGSEYNDVEMDAGAMDDGVGEEVTEEQLVKVIVNEVLEDNDSDSVHSEYLPTKSPTKAKKRRGRPRKTPTKGAGSGGATPSRPRGRLSAAQRAEREAAEELAALEEEGDAATAAAGEGNVFLCPSCDDTFPRMILLERHVRKHHDVSKAVPHACKACGKVFSRFNHLKRHMYSHAVVKPFGCDQCGKKFSRRDHLQQHLRLHEKRESHVCDVCARPFSRADQLAKHKATKHGDGEKGGGAATTMADKRFECHVCNKSFTTEKYRDVHQKAHMGEKLYKCKTCDKGFLSKSHLTEHIKFHNEHSKKFLCSECGQRFIRNDYLVIHMRRHRGEKPFKCKFCGKGFPRTTDLTVHERYHTGEKTHLCTICGRGFGRAYNLTVHMRTHTGEKPYRCTYCDAAFAQGNDLKAHVRRHTGERFQCELCSESFLMGYLLTQHKRTVHGLNVVSNIRRLQPTHKVKPETDEAPPITIPLPKPVVPENILNNLQAQIAHQMHQQLSRGE